MSEHDEKACGFNCNSAGAQRSADAPKQTVIGLFAEILRATYVEDERAVDALDRIRALCARANEVHRRERATNWPTSDEGDTHTRLTRIVDENLSYRPTASIDSLLSDLEKELPQLKARAERAEAALEFAIALAEEGWSYASRYFVDKWDAEGRAAELRKLADVSEDEPLPTTWAEHIIAQVRESSPSSGDAQTNSAKEK